MPAPSQAPGSARPVARQLEHLAARCLLGLLRITPAPCAIPVAEAIGLAVGSMVRRWRTTADSNLRAAFPELDAGGRQRIVRGVFRNLGRVAWALAKAPSWSSGSLAEQVDFRGLEHFEAARARGLGVMLLTAHLGNWELGALAHGAALGPIHVVVRPIENPLVDRLVEQRRNSHGNGVIEKSAAAREILRVLRSNGTVGILADQHALPEEAVPVNFFGRQALANRGFAQIALRSKAAVVPAVAWWDPRARRHVVEYGPRIELARSDDPAREIAVNTQRFQAAIEERVRTHPDQWLWIHRRWKGSVQVENPEAD